MASAHLNYCFLPYGTVKTRCRWISHRPHTNMPKTDIWLATGYLVPDGDQQHKIFVVNSLNIFATCRILRVFPLASKYEIMTFIK